MRHAPIVAGVATSLADPGGPIELAKETAATLRSATLPPSQEELLASVGPGHRGNGPAPAEAAGDFKPNGGEQVLEELREVDQLVTGQGHARGG
jgi:hypothetical protein